MKRLSVRLRVAGFTFDLDVDGVLAVLDAMHHLATVDARVAGTQLADLQSGVGGHQGVADHGHPVHVLGGDSHLPLCGHQDDRLAFLGDPAPFDPGGEGGSTGVAGVMGCAVQEVTGHDQRAAQQGVQWRLPRDAHAQCTSWVYGEREGGSTVRGTETTLIKVQFGCSFNFTDAL